MQFAVVKRLQIFIHHCFTRISSKISINNHNFLIIIITKNKINSKQLLKLIKEHNCRSHSPVNLISGANRLAIMNPCTIAAPFPDTEGDERWICIHKRFLSECREKDPDVIFLGDCIFETLQDTETWYQYFAPLHCLNFSIRNDRTENVLWRVENGELDNVKPKVGI